MWISILGLITGIVTVILIATQPKHQTVVQQTVYPGIPDSFTDFSGTISAVNTSGLTVHFSGLNSRGVMVQKDYSVTTDPTTRYQEMNTTTGAVTSATFTASTLHPNDRVIVAAKDNIAGVTSFTATSIILLRTN
jgi:hypothetical protein